MFSACEVYDCDDPESDSKKRPEKTRESPARSSLVDLIGFTELRVSPSGSGSGGGGSVGNRGSEGDCFITLDACTL